MEFGGFYGITATQLMFLDLTDEEFMALVKSANNVNERQKIINLRTELELLKSFIKRIPMTIGLLEDDAIHNRISDIVSTKYSDRQQGKLVTGRLKITRGEDGKYDQQTLVKVRGNLNRIQRALEESKKFYSGELTKQPNERTLLSQEEVIEFEGYISKFPKIIADTIKIGGKDLPISLEEKKIIQRFIGKSMARKIDSYIAKLDKVDLTEVRVLNQPIGNFSNDNDSEFYRVFSAFVKGRAKMFDPIKQVPVITEELDKFKSFLDFNKTQDSDLNKMHEYLEDTIPKKLGVLTYSKYQNEFNLENINANFLEDLFVSLDRKGLVGLNTFAKFRYLQIRNETVSSDDRNFVIDSSSPLASAIRDAERYLDSQFVQGELIQ